MKVRSRLVAPTILSILLCSLLFDYLMYLEGRWSLFGVVWKVLSVLLSVFTPSLADISIWFSDLTQMMWAVYLAILVLTIWILVFFAKASMRVATPDTDTEMPLGLKSQSGEIANKFSPVIEDVKRITKFSWRLRGIVYFASLATIFSFAAWTIAGQVLERWKYEEIRIRGRMTTESLANATLVLEQKDGKVFEGALDRFLRKPEILYFFIIDKSGKVIKQSPKNVITERERDMSQTGVDDSGESHMRYRGGAVFEASRPLTDAMHDERILHVGIRKDIILGEMASLGMLAVMIACSAVVAIALFSLVWMNYFRRLRSLVDQAESIAGGNINVAVKSIGADELSEIGYSIERLRASLIAANKREVHAKLG